MNPTPAIGPLFDFVDEIGWDQLNTNGGFGRRMNPVLIKGAVKMWPAWESWSFEKLAELKQTDGSDTTAQFITGVVEQGATKELKQLPLIPIFRT